LHPLPPLYRERGRDGRSSLTATASHYTHDLGEASHEAPPEPSMKPAKVLFQPGAEADAQWHVEGLRALERLGEPYELTVALRTDDRSTEPAALLGQAATVII
jgi:hypothetical protein